MADAERRNSNKKAYQDFLNGLADISQREPLKSEHLGAGVPDRSKEELAKLARQANWERLIQTRFAADCTYRFKQRLKKRVKAFYHAKSRGSDPMPEDFRYGVPIRRDTAELLMRTAESDNDFGAVLSVAFGLLMYVNLLYGNVTSLWALTPTDEVAWSLLGFGFTRNQLLWTFFLCKECLFITFPLAMTLIGLVLATVAVVMSPFMLAYYAIMIHGREEAIRKNRKLWDESIYPILAVQINMLKSLIKSLSTTRMCIKMFQQLRNKECNPSFKDFDMILLTLSNTMFSIVILIYAVHNGRPIPASEMTSIPISLLLLLKSFIGHRMYLRQIYQSLKDVNENRLSKFELALLLTKYSEIMLSADVQYNFVQHFYTGPDDPLEPDVRPLDNEDEEDILEEMPPLPAELAKEFGHDMMKEYKHYTGPALPYHPSLRAQ